MKKKIIIPIITTIVAVGAIGTVAYFTKAKTTVAETTSVEEIIATETTTEVAEVETTEEIKEETTEETETTTKKTSTRPKDYIPGMPAADYYNMTHPNIEVAEADNEDETPKADKTETKTEAPKSETTEAPKTEEPSQPETTTEAPKSETTEAPKQESTTEAPKQETTEAQMPEHYEILSFVDSNNNEIGRLTYTLDGVLVSSWGITNSDDPQVYNVYDYVQ